MGEQATYYCPNCWEEIPPGTITCPHCHQPVGADAEKEFFDKVVDALRHPIPSKAAFAAQVLGKTGDPRGVDPLLQVVERSRDPELQEAAIRALGRLRDPRAVTPFVRVLNDENVFMTLRIAAADALGQIGGEPAIAALQTAAHRDDRGVSRAAREALSTLGVAVRR